MPCFLCSHNITPSEACGALEFAGDALAERGRYAVHRECLRPEWRKKFVTREQLLMPAVETEGTAPARPWQGLVAPQPGSHRLEMSVPHDDLVPLVPTAPQGLLARFFLWGARRFAGGIR